MGMKKNGRDVCIFDGTVHYIHKEGDQVLEKENEFHFRHAEGLEII